LERNANKKDAAARPFEEVGHLPHIFLAVNFNLASAEKYLGFFLNPDAFGKLEVVVQPS